MPAKSEAQRRTFGAALGVQRGEQRLRDLPPGLRGQVKRLVRDARQGKVDLTDFAQRPRGARLPEKA